MIRNSDVLFGRTAATYQFAEREIIRQVIQEVSSLQVLGIDKRMHQIMFERSYLTIDQIYAILESLIQSKQLKKIKTLVTYVFDESDEKRFYDYLRLPYESQEPIVQLPSEVPQDLPIPSEELLLCLNLKHSLKKAGISAFLLNIIADKQLLNTRFLKIFPDLTEKRQVIVCPEDRTQARIQYSIGLLFAQIAVVQSKLKASQVGQSLFIWQSLQKLGLELRYSEVLCYLCFLDEPNATRIATTLAEISGVDQHPRLPFLPFNSTEQGYFDQLVAKGALPLPQLEQSKALLLRVHQEGLTQMRLSDIMVVQGIITHKSIAQQWADLRKKEVASQVQHLQLERTQEMPQEQELTKSLHQELEQNAEILRQADDGERRYRVEARRKIVVRSSAEDHEFEKELDETFNQTQEQRIRELHEEAEFFQTQLKSVSPEQARGLYSMLAVYRHKDYQYLWLKIGAILVLSMLLGVMLFVFKKPTDLEISNPPEILPKPISLEEIVRPQMNLAEQWIRLHQYQKALDIYNHLLSISDSSLPWVVQIRMQQQRCERLLKLHQSLTAAVAQSLGEVVFVFRNRPECQIQEIKESGLVISIARDSMQVIVAWQELNPVEMVQIWKSYGILQSHPWEVALFCAENKLIEELREALAIYLDRFPVEKKQACDLLRSVTMDISPDEAYQIYQNKLYSQKEIQRMEIASPVTEPQVPVSNPSPGMTMVATDWRTLTTLQTQLLLQQREAYAQSMQKAGAIWQNQRWTQPQLWQFEQDAQENIRFNRVFFQEKWISREQLGIWHDIILKKGNQASAGFLLPIKGLYEFHTANGTLYLHENQIAVKKPGIYPWDLYWTLKPLATNILEHHWLGQWCQWNELKSLAQIQAEQVLTIGPNHPEARKFLGYTRLNQAWVPQNQIKIQDKWTSAYGIVNLGQSLRLGLFVQNDSLVLREQLALQEWQAEKTGTTGITASSPRILGTQAKLIKDDQWQIQYSFKSQENLQPWVLDEAVRIQDESLEIRASGEQPKFIAWKIPMSGDLTIHSEIFFPERPAKNFMIQFFRDPTATTETGYCLALNDQEPGQAMQHCLKVYNGSSTETLAAVKEPLLPSKRWIKLTIKVAGDKIEVSLQRQRIFRITNKQYRKGILRFGTRQSSIRLDEMLVLGQFEPHWYKQQEKSEQGLTKTCLGIPNAMLQTWNALPPQLWQMWKQERYLLLQNENIPAWNLCQQMLKEYPGFSLALLDRGLLRLRFSDIQGAADEFQNIVQHYPDWDSAWIARAELWAMQGKYQEALNDLAQAMILNPKNLAIYYALVQFYLEIGRQAQALAAAEKAQEEIPDSLLKKDLEQYSSAEIKLLQTYDHYEIHGKISTVFVHAVGFWLSGIQEHYRKIFGKIPEQKCKIILFETRDEMNEYIRLYVPEASAQVAYWIPRTRQIILSVDQHPLVWNVALLECVTQEWLLGISNSPQWLIQGLHAYGTYSPFEENLWNWVNVTPYSQKQISLTIESFSLKELLGTELGGLVDHQWQFSIQSYAWIHFLIHAQQGKYVGLLQTCLQKAQQGMTWQQIHADVFSSSTISRLESACKEYWQKK